MAVRKRVSARPPAGQTSAGRPSAVDSTSRDRPPQTPLEGRSAFLPPVLAAPQHGGGKSVTADNRSSATTSPVPDLHTNPPSRDGIDRSHRTSGAAGTQRVSIVRRVVHCCD